MQNAPACSDQQAGQDRAFGYMNVGVLTFHGSSNPGAFWQAYATCQLLRRLGHTASIIDYYPPSRHQRSHWAAMRRAAAWRRPDLLAVVIGQRIAAARSRGVLPIGPPIPTSTDLAATSYDAVVIGSDVVWEAPVDPACLGIGLRTDRLVAYAASAGGCDASTMSIPEGMRRPCPFQSVSVRDRNTFRLLERIGWANRTQLLSDPTLTLEVPAELLLRPVREPYLLVYCSTRLPPETVSAIRGYARKKNLIVIAAFYPQRWADRNALLLTAQSWMSYVANAACVVTNTFHGAVVACLRDRPLAVVDLSEKTARKSLDQFSTLGVDRRIVEGSLSLTAAFEMAWTFVENDARRAAGRTNTQFLRGALGDP